MKQVLKNRAFALAAAALLAAVLAVIGIAAQDAPKAGAPKPDAPKADAPKADAPKPQDKIVVRLVAAEMPDKLISELQVISSIEDPTFDSASRSNTARRPSLGDDATLWVRGASVDGVHGFERITIQDGKEYYLGRKAELELAVDLAVPPPAAPAPAAPAPAAPKPGEPAPAAPKPGEPAPPVAPPPAAPAPAAPAPAAPKPGDAAPAALKPGEHAIEPGHHVFTLAPDGKLSSTDPDIAIDNAARTVTLKTYRIEIMNADANKSGPPETRLLGKPLGLRLLSPGQEAPPADGLGKLPTLIATDTDSPLNFSPLRVYLPANTSDRAYLLTPALQPFHVRPGGVVEFKGPRTSGVAADNSRIVVSYVTFSAWVRTATGLTANYGGTGIPETGQAPCRIRVGPMRGDPLFWAGVAGLSSRFGLRLSGDLDRYPAKFMVADNTRQHTAVRLMTLESGGCVFERGTTATARLQYRENSLALTPAAIQKAEPLLQALLAAVKNPPPKPATALERVCAYVLQLPKDDDRKAMSAWLESPDAATKEKFESGVLPVLGRLNELLFERAFFDPAALAELKVDEALRKDVGNLATLDENQVLRVNRRLLELVFPGVFAPPPAEWPRPTVRLAYSPFIPTDYTGRAWTSFPSQAWEGDKLTFTTPDIPYGFYFFRVMLFSPEDQESVSTLAAEFAAAVIEPKQDGTACFVSNKGRDAFAPGEAIRLQAVFRSRSPRPAGARTVVLRQPDGREDRLALEDPGDKWYSRMLVIPETTTRRLLPGRYELAVTDLPPQIVCYPFRFDVAAPRESLYRIIKPSKYTYPMWSLQFSHSGMAKGGEGAPVDLERAVASLAELGYNRIDHQNYLEDYHYRLPDPRGVLAETDARLVPPDAIFLPSPRDQILNACVRHGMEFADTLVVRNDHHLPRYIDGYINAAERWMRREVTSMRHSPAFDGMLLYDEVYERALVHESKLHGVLWPALRLKKAEQDLGLAPAKIRTEMSRYVAKEPAQRDPQALEHFLALRQWEMHGWGDFNTRVAAAAHDVLPRVRIGAYQISFMTVQSGYGAVASAADFDCGYHPDVFANLDFAASQHYTDGPITAWVHCPIMIQLQRRSPRDQRPVWVNVPMGGEPRTLYDGQLQRRMAFAVMGQGAAGVSQYWIPVEFGNGPNSLMLKGKETTRWLNSEILAPFGELMTSTDPGYLKVGIVNTLNQLSLSEFKPIRTANQLEELWVACWRLGYPAVFLREPDLEKPLEGYQVIFVPGIRFDGELSPVALQRLEQAAAAGCKVVVERDSTLKVKDQVRLEDFALMNFFYGANYGPHFYDDELARVFEKSQPAVDYFGPKLAKWAEPAARGPFTVGPNWRTGGDIHYLVMANFDFPDYNYTVKDMMSKPERLPLTVPARRGAAAYDLLARAELPLGPEKDGERSLVLDMTRCQGALAAFLPEPIAALRLAVRRDPARTAVLLKGELLGASGKAIVGAFPARLQVLDGQGQPRYTLYRVLDSRGELELANPLTAGRAGGLTVEVTENISGQTARLPLEAPAGAEPVLRLDDPGAPQVPYPAEVRRFLKTNPKVTLALGHDRDGLKAEADRLVAGLKAAKIEVTVVPESRAWHVPGGDPSLPDPKADGFHNWSGSMGECPLIEPRAAVDSPLILISPAGGSYLLNTLVEKGFVTERPVGAAGLPVPPTIQVASRGLHWKYDTLCIVANDGAGLRRAVDRVLAELAARDGGRENPPARPAFGPPEPHESRDPVKQAPALSFMGNNEYILDLKFDAAGNSYAITWGHGDNLYALDPAGKFRYSWRLPEMGACRLDVDADRLAVYTACGSRLYQLALDGKPISQARLTMDPGEMWLGPNYRIRHLPDLFRHNLGNNAETFRYLYVPGTRLVVYLEPLTRKVRVLDENFNFLTEWEGNGVDEFVGSPDGTRLAAFEGASLVLRELKTGNKLAESPRPLGGLWWPKEQPGPTVGPKHFDAQLKVLRTDPAAPAGTLFDLGPLGGLIPDGKDLRLVRLTDTGPTEVARLGPFAHSPTFFAVSPDQKSIVFLDEYWQAFVHNLATGKRTGQLTLPEMGFALTFTPDSQAFLVGGLRGSVMRVSLDGKLLWRTSLGEHNQSLSQATLPNLEPRFPDHTAKLWQPQFDQPGELDQLVAFDRSRLVNGDAEAEGGWQQGEDGKGQATYAEGGYQSKRCLKVGAAPVQQQFEGLIGDHFTWVLEFFYRSATPDKTVRLLAGVNALNRHPDNVVRVLTAEKDWAFARLALKSGGDAKALQVGFQAQGGDALVDSVTLRRIRFPSVNHLLYPPVYDVEPVILNNPLFYKDYKPLPEGLEDRIPNKVVPPQNVTGAVTLLAYAYLQNGRLNDITSNWYTAPMDDEAKTPTNEGRDTTLSLGLKDPRWISMVALYFNAYDAANAPPHFDVYVSDVDRKQIVRVASIRNSRSLFRVVKFPPCRADMVQVLLVNALPRMRTLTEVELYGPLAGTDKDGFVDAEGQNTYMGTFARVDKRRLLLAPAYEQKRVANPESSPNWAVPTSQILMAGQELYLSRAYGFNQRFSLEPLKLEAPATSVRTGGMGFGPHVTLYGGVLLKPGSDGKLYCIDPASGRPFWSTVLGERLTGNPAAIGPDVFVATDTGKLYTLDLATGAILGELKLSGPVYGSVAADEKNLFVITAAGRLHGIQAVDSRELWSVAVAPDTDATPAVDAGVVYLADQKGTAKAVQVADGKVLWSSELESEFCRCPVVLADLVVFGGSDGRLTALNRRTGERVWQTPVKTRFLRYEPVPLLLAGAGSATALLYLADGKPELLDAATGKPADRQVLVGEFRDGKLNPQGFGLDKLLAPISYYRGCLAFVPTQFDDVDAPIYNDLRIGVTAGSANLLTPIWGFAPDLKNVKPARLDRPIRADGALDEWGPPAAVLDRQGPDAMNVKVYFGFDGEAFGVAAEVADDKHCNTKTGDQIWNGDALQVGLLVKNVHWNFALALAKDGVAFHQFAGQGDAPAKTAERAVVRDENAKLTRYELRLPLAAVGLEPGAEFGFDVGVLDDDDGNGQRCWIQLAPSLLGRGPQDPPAGTAYPRFTLPK